MHSAYVARLGSLLIVLLMVALSLPGGEARAQQASTLPDHVVQRFGQPPAIPGGPLSGQVRDAVRIVFMDAAAQSDWDARHKAALELIASSADPRLAWTISDMMRFSWRKSFDDDLASAAARLLRIEIKTPRRWAEITDHLMAWDVPAYPGYLDTKRAIFTGFVPGWDRIFVEGDDRLEDGVMGWRADR
jgi:hypothetical protein